MILSKRGGGWRGASTNKPRDVLKSFVSTQQKFQSNHSIHLVERLDDIRKGKYWQTRYAEIVHDSSQYIGIGNNLTRNLISCCCYIDKQSINPGKPRDQSLNQDLDKL